jgi:VWFA-related protein
VFTNLISLSHLLVWRVRVLAMLTFIFASLVVSEPVAGRPQEQDARPRFEVTVGMTRIKAAVIDANGEPVPGLVPSDFRVWENGVEQEITLVLDPVRFSLDMALVLDFSASIERDWSAVSARQAAHGFLDQLGADDCVFLLPFNSQVGPGVWGKPDDVILRAAIDDQGFKSYTRLYDAILVAHDALDQRRPDSASAAAEELADTLYGTWMEPVTDASCGEPLDPYEARQRRAAMVLLTDGEDSGSRAGYADALMASWRSEVPVFAIGVGQAAQRVRYRGSTWSRRTSRQQFEAIAALQDQLREIARVSGGQLILQQDLADGYATTLGLLRGYYVLAYVSPEGVEDGWQKLEVKLTEASAEVVVQPGVYRNEDSHVVAVNILREASVKFAMGQYEEALADFDHVARFSPDIGAPYFGRALVLEKLGRYAEARDSFARSLELRPGVPATHSKLAEISLRVGDYEQAWEHAIRAHLGGFSQIETFEALDKVSEQPQDFRARLVGPVVFFMRPRVPELDAQLALADVSHKILAGLDTTPMLAVTNDFHIADVTISVWVRKLGDDGKLSARLVLYDLASSTRREQGLTIDDVRDKEAVQAAISEALEEAREWILERHEG